MLATIKRIFSKIAEARSRSVQRRIQSELDYYVTKHNPQNAAEVDHLITRFYRKDRNLL